MALSVSSIQKAYIAFFNRPADVTGLNYWLNYTGNDQDLLTEFSRSAEYLSDFAGLTNTQVVEKVYMNLFGRAPETEGLNYWVNSMNQGWVTVANVAYEVMGGAQGTDASVIENKTTAATDFTNALDTPEESAAYDHAGDNGMANTAKDWLSTVDSSGTSLSDAQAGIGNVVQQLVDANVGGGDPGQDGETIWLGGQDPTIAGTANNDTFVAEPGQVTDATILDGMGGNDTLNITLRAEQAIAPTVRNIEKVVIRAQDNASPAGVDNNIDDVATVDADRFTGVNWWESKNARVDTKVENVNILNNQLTKDITIAFRESDPGHVDYAVYFDQAALRNQTSTSGVLHAALYDSMGATAGLPLQNNPYDVIAFSLDGSSVVHRINFGSVKGESTFQDLADAIQAAIDATPALAAYNLTVNLVSGVHYNVPNDTAAAHVDAGYYLEIAASGHTITEQGWATSTGIIPPNNSTQTRQDSASASATTLVTSTVDLDYVGKGSMGGDLVIGAQSTGDTSTSKGVQQFDVTVERDSKLEVVSSTNNSLQVVNLVNKGTYNYLGAFERDSNKGARSGDLTILGDTAVNTIFEENGLTTKPVLNNDGNNTAQGDADQDIDGAGAQQDNGYGLTDVRVVNGANFAGNLTLNAILTENVVGKYLDLTDQAPAEAAADNRSFDYTLGNGNDALDLAISSANLQAAGTTTREDFVLNIKGGAGNDAISTAILDDQGDLAESSDVWYTNSQGPLNIDAGAGNDTVRTLGSGNWTVTLGTGNDTYYGDNTGNKAVYVFNTTDQYFDSTAADQLDNLTSSANHSHYIYGLKLRVAVKDAQTGTFLSKAIDVPTTGNQFTVTDRNINQAIKAAINSDPVLSKLYVAKDGPANTLVVTALSDGLHSTSGLDLQVDFTVPVLDLVDQATADAWAAITGGTATPTGVATESLAHLNTLLDPDNVGAAAKTTAGALTDHVAWRTSVQDTDAAGSGDYGTSFAGDETTPTTEKNGSDSTHATDNRLIVDGAAGDQDVLVLATGTASNDSITWNGTFNNGTVTVVNFGTGALGAGGDFLDFTAYGATWLGAATLTSGAAGNVWSQSDDITGVTAVTPGSANQAIGAGGLALAEGDKYITLTRADVNTTTYKAELWTVVGAEVDAYLAASPATADTAQLIGYVDLGQSLEGVAIADALSHIDFIA